MNIQEEFNKVSFSQDELENLQLVGYVAGLQLQLEKTRRYVRDVREKLEFVDRDSDNYFALMNDLIDLEVREKRLRELVE